MLVGIGGGFGAIVRYQIGVFIGKKGTFPIATFLINVIGSFLLGYLTGNLNNTCHQFLCIGFLGGFTTFSTFGVETNTLLINKKYRVAIVYVVSSAIISIAACFIGYLL